MENITNTKDSEMRFDDHIDGKDDDDDEDDDFDDEDNDEVEDTEMGHDDDEDRDETESNVKNGNQEYYRSNPLLPFAIASTIDETDPPHNLGRMVALLGIYKYDYEGLCACNLKMLLLVYHYYYYYYFHHPYDDHHDLDCCYCCCCILH